MSDPDLGDHVGPDWIAHRLGLTLEVLDAIRHCSPDAYRLLRLLAAFLVRQQQRLCPAGVASYGKEDLASELFVFAAWACHFTAISPTELVVVMQREASRLLSRERRQRPKQVPLDAVIENRPGPQSEDSIRPLMLKLAFGAVARLPKRWRPTLSTTYRQARELCARHGPEVACVHLSLTSKFVIALAAAIRKTAKSLSTTTAASDEEGLLTNLLKVTSDPPGRGDRTRARICQSLLITLALHGVIRGVDLD